MLLVSAFYLRLDACYMKLSVDLKLTPEQLAEAFCDLNDEQQAQFFIEAARIGETWPTKHGGASVQWYKIGKHLQTCECSTDDARSMVRDIHDGVTTGS